MRGALAYATHHATHRIAFGRMLSEQPLMMAVLADMALEVEGATALALRLARAFDAASNESEQALARIITPAAKYWVCKRAPMVALEAMEVLGGNGYVEETPLARLYREAPVNSIWEGSGNVVCLDVMRALRRERASIDALFAEIDAARGVNRDLDAYAAALRELAIGSDDQAWARRLAQSIAVAFTASLLVRQGPAFVADAFCASRLRQDVAFSGPAFGTLPSGVDMRALIRRVVSGK